MAKVHSGGGRHDWWAVPLLPGGVNNGAFSANGSFCQLIFVNPTEQVVVAIQSGWSAVGAGINIIVDTIGPRKTIAAGPFGARNYRAGGPAANIEQRIRGG
jgi:CubicO group peptidase (beta-lactamase class C family)